MARPMWTGAISFGLVNIPVKLFSAVRHKEVHFHMLHREDGGRIRQKRVCSVDGEEVPYEDISKGYELTPGNYVMIDPAELDGLDPKATRTIDIEDFVDLAEIDPVFYENNYYLAPDRGAGKPYGLLLEAMRRTNKVGVARMVMRTKQYLCAIRPMGNVLALHTLLYADEVVPQDDIEELGQVGRPGARELTMAEQLVGSLSGKWTPQKYKDDYRERVLDLIKRKAEGQEIVAPPAEEEPARVVNLMDALRRSLSEAQKTARAAEQAAGEEERVAEEGAGEIRHRAQAARTTRPSSSRKEKGSRTRSKKKKTASRKKSSA